MRALLDVNVLVALFDPDHACHERAHQWFDANQVHGWASCPLTEDGVLRVLGHPRYSPQLHRAPGEIVADLRSACEGSNHRFWAADLGLWDECFLWSGQIHSARQVAGVYLLGLAVKNGGCLATFDTDIPHHAVIGAMPVHLAVI